MNLLVLGGTRFVGRHIAEKALTKGHRVTLFHRTATDVLPECEHILGDRNESLTPLAGRTWDGVIDTCAYFPRQVKLAGEALAGAAEHYLLISTISVYADPYPDSPDENSPLATLEDPTVETVDGGTYGGLKVLCEKEAATYWEDRLLVLRPGLIVGPHDPTDRFTYWVVQLGRGGRFVAPARLDQPVQFLDVRDLASFAVASMESQLTGTMNTVGPGAELTWDGLFQVGRLLFGPSESVVLPDLDQDRLPMALSAEADGIFRVNGDLARQNGLTNRPAEETLRDTWKWWQGLESRALKVGLIGGEQLKLLS